MFTELLPENRSMDILHVALDVHMTTTGSMERSYATGDQEQQADIEILKKKLANWEPSIKRSLAFDNAVRALIVAALAEVEVEANAVPSL